MTKLPTAQTPWYAGKGGGGVTTHTRNEAQSFARKILSSQRYRDGLEKRLIAGILPPAVETMLWHYAYGKPADTVNVNVAQNTIAKMSAAELAQVTRTTLQELEEAARLEEALEEELAQHPTVQ